MRRERRPLNVFNLSFLDVISCGFGAIILLLVISKASEPLVLKRISVDLTARVQELRAELQQLRERSRRLNLELDSIDNRMVMEEKKIGGLLKEKSALLGQFRAARTEAEALTRIERGLETARQTLTDEMKRLSTMKRPYKKENIIGGVPVDSEHVIFVIDTSGSMYRYAWPLVQKKMREILAIYPHVKGIQVMNDMGDYMFPQYAGRWIPDTPARRKVILRRLLTWTPFSNSSPVEGIERAISSFRGTAKKMSIYYFGDDFSHGSIQEVIDTIDRLNRAYPGGKRIARIHAVGFPTLILHNGNWGNVVRFAALMRRLAEDNSGSFVGLNGLYP